MAAPCPSPGQRLGHFRLLEQIGAGGMGVVFRAHDEELDRDVALKVLPPGAFEDPAARARMQREARSAAALNHPNICTVHQVGECDGHMYIAMEVVEGEPLNVRLQSGALPSGEVSRYGMQLADALAHAHERGVLHRDLKSANVVVTHDGRAKVLDFGLAKRLGAGELGEVTCSQESLTAAGAVVGTLPYMSPEQLRGQAVDARSDVWALGVVLYEMASGKLPFRGNTGFELSSAILDQAPASLPGGVPAELCAVIDRCLEKEPSRRYQSAREVWTALETVSAGGTTAWATRRYYLRQRRWAALVIAGLLVMAVAAILFRGVLRRVTGGGAQPRIESIAVLPLENLSGDTAQEYFADGMTEAVITELSSIQGVRRVVARSSVMRFKHTQKRLSEVARELQVQALITGAVLRSADRVQITAQLIDPATEQQLWAHRFEASVRDVIALQGDVAGAVAREIKAAITPQEATRLVNRRPVNPEAYDAYLKGRFEWYLRTPEALNNAERYFQLALKYDADYAPAYVGIGIVWYRRADLGLLPPGEVLHKTRAALLKAVQLDDNLADAHSWLGIVAFTNDWDWPTAEKQFRRALELNPGDAEAHFMYSDFLITLKRNAEWQVEMQKALQLDPPNLFYNVFYGWHLVYLGRYDEAIAQMRKVQESQPDDSSAHMGIWGAYFKKKDYGQALDSARKFFAALHDDEAVAALDRGNAEGGYRRAMKRAGDVLAARAKKMNVSPIRIARLYAHAGESDLAMDWLEKAYSRHDVNLIHINVGWDWDGLRGNPRFQELVRKLNLP